MLLALSYLPLPYATERWWKVESHRAFVYDVIKHMFSLLVYTNDFRLSFLDWFELAFQAFDFESLGHLNDTWHRFILY